MSMMRRGIVTVAALAALAPTTAGAAPAHHHRDHRPCVSTSELERVDEGWTRARFERFTETTDEGAKLGGYPVTYYGESYPACHPGRRVIAYFRVLDDTLVVAKTVRGGTVSTPLP